MRGIFIQRSVVSSYLAVASTLYWLSKTMYCVGCILIFPLSKENILLIGLNRGYFNPLDLLTHFTLERKENIHVHSRAHTTMPVLHDDFSSAIRLHWSSVPGPAWGSGAPGSLFGSTERAFSFLRAVAASVSSANIIGIP